MVALVLHHSLMLSYLNIFYYNSLYRYIYFLYLAVAASLQVPP